MDHAAKRVLLSHELLLLVGRFQNGLPEYLIPFRQLSHQAPCANIHVWKLQPAMDKIHAVLDPWLQIHGVDELSRVFYHLPHMEDIVPSYGVYFARLDLVEAVAAKFPHTFRARSKLLDFAATSTSLDMVEYILNHGYTGGSTVEAIMAASRQGNLSMLIQLELFFPVQTCYSMALYVAVQCDHIHIARHLLPRCQLAFVKPALVDMTTKGCHLDLVFDSIEATQDPLDRMALESACFVTAVNNDRIEFAQRLLNHSLAPTQIWTEWRGTFVSWHDDARKDVVTIFLEGAVISGNLVFAEQILDQSRMQLFEDDYVEMAAHYGHAEMTQWLQTRKREARTSCRTMWC
ncbi:Aste57867_378 [Aphanomyces stellatus]|uniref:Aste57867_378 protein n=1 Tax=Aphanomyces stellatus TaxID=120398 RepID=A0A485K6L4_9STRA|nr:hypothetical protein As57867_000377 [Aphanomyces stellatus]VFT77603.1 Aste57867_378 [Aphanomyces stellatus]